MTNAQTLTVEFRVLTAPGMSLNTWKWARRVTAALDRLDDSWIGDSKGRKCSIAIFRCADGSRFAYDLNGACQVWAIPADQDSAAA